MQEADVGIVAFATSAPPISAILRHRYTDFKVNEIDESMCLARLVVGEVHVVKQAAKTWDNVAAADALVAALAACCNDSDVQQLGNFLERLRNNVRSHSCHFSTCAVVANQSVLYSTAPCAQLWQNANFANSHHYMTAVGAHARCRVNSSVIRRCATQRRPARLARQGSAHKRAQAVQKRPRLAASGHRHGAARR